MSDSMKDVFHITERNSSGGEPAKSVWTKIGVAFVNKDQSLNVFLQTLPIDGKLHIREQRATKSPQK
jgi:hypothetical protein